VATLSFEWTAGWLEFNVPFQHKYGYIRDKLEWMDSDNKFQTRSPVN